MQQLEHVRWTNLGGKVRCASVFERIFRRYFVMYLRRNVSNDFSVCPGFSGH